MSSSLGAVIATIFMAELESILIHKLNDHVKKWKGLVNNYVLSALILFHDNKRPTEKKLAFSQCFISQIWCETTPSLGKMCKRIFSFSTSSKKLRV